MSEQGVNAIIDELPQTTPAEDPQWSGVAVLPDSRRFRFTARDLTRDGTYATKLVVGQSVRVLLRDGEPTALSARGNCWQPAPDLRRW